MLAKYFLDTSNATRVNFTTGIFDNLALITNEKYNLGFKGVEISLNSKAGKKFLKSVKGANPNVHAHIKSNVNSNNFITTIYHLREIAVHGESLKSSIHVDENGWEMIELDLDKNIRNHIRLCGEKKLKYLPLTDWGVHETYWKSLNHLEPFHFVKAATKFLIKFSNEYLRLLGFNDFIKELKVEDKPMHKRFVLNIELIKKDSLKYTNSL